MTNSPISLSSSSDSDGPVILLRPQNSLRGSRSPLNKSNELVERLANLCLRATPPPSRPTSPLPPVFQQTPIEQAVVAFPVTQPPHSLQELVGQSSDFYDKLMDTIQLLAPPLIDFSDRVRVCPKASEFRSTRKNRYPNVFAADLNRVCLKKSADPDSDYINANHFANMIITQGPLENTLTDFWTMIFEQEVSQIVCLTNDKDPHPKNHQTFIDKCYPYWNPQQAGTQDNLLFSTPLLNVRVSCPPTTVGQDGDQILERLLIVVSYGTDMRLVELFRYVNWPDHGACSLTLFGTLIETQRKSLYRGKCTVHCSAGIGRSGIFAVVSSLLDAHAKSQLIPTKTNIIEQIVALRQRRPGAVQNPTQLQMICQALHLLIHN